MLGYHIARRKMGNLQLLNYVLLFGRIYAEIATSIVLYMILQLYQESETIIAVLVEALQYTGACKLAEGSEENGMLCSGRGTIPQRTGIMMKYLDLLMHRSCAGVRSRFGGWW